MSDTVSGCDFCQEGLPLWHRREPDSEGLEGAQFMPCEKDRPTPNQILYVLDKLIDAGCTPADVRRVKDWLL